MMCTRPASEIRIATAPRGILRLLAFALVATVGCSSPGPPLNVVDDVDLDRYSGRWYEIASYPQRFQRGCVATTADYARSSDGRIQVTNECRDGSFDGRLRRVEGVAWPANPDRREGKLKVRFFWPFAADYWIIELDPDYRFAIVGHPSRKYLWILARTPTIDPTLHADLIARVRAHGYDPERLNETPQPLSP